jgi:Aspartyl protease
MRLTSLAIGIGALFLLPGLTRAQHKADRTLQVPYELANRRGGMLLHVKINDTPALMILGSGSAHTIIQPRVLGGSAPKLAPARPRPEGVGFIGDAVAYEVQFQVGEWKWKRCTVVVMDLAHVLAVYSERVDGLFGLDFLQEFSSVFIDTKTRKITFRK